MADNYLMRDAVGSLQSMRAKDDGNGNKTPQSIPSDATGVPYSPTNGLPTAPQRNAPRVRAAGPLAALNAALTLPLDGMSTAILKLSGGPWVGTVTLFGSVDDGATFDIPLTMAPFSPGAAIGSASANGTWEVACGGLTHIQAVMTAFTSGSATALLVGGNGLKSVRVGAPAGNPLPTKRGLGTRIDASIKPSSGAITATYGNVIGIIAADATRNGDWFAQNQSGADLLLVMDDGTDAVSTMLPMNQADSAGRQGGSYTSQNLGPHVGRLRVYGPAGSQFALTAQ